MAKLVKSSKAQSFGNTIFESVAVGSAYELLRHDVMEHLAELQKDMHYKYCRFHGLFNERMAVAQRQEDGHWEYQWHLIDKITDNLLSLGLKPFFELSDMPDEMASGDSREFVWGMNTSEPGDYDEWGELVENFVRHTVLRYGLQEVKTWYFEVWNEPNIKSFWPIGMDAYYKLYRYTAEAVKRADPELRVGGPATAGGVYIKDLIDYCCDNGVPLDFITTHAYPIGDYCEYGTRENSPYELGEYFIERFKEVKQTVLSSRMPDLEIHWTEWNTQSSDNSEYISWSCNPTVDWHYGGACVVKNMLGVRNVCNSVAYWVVSDVFGEFGMPHSVFSCSYGLMNIHGIKKATYNAYKLLRKMRGNVMEIQNEGQYPTGCGMEATEEKGIIRIIAYNERFLEIKEQPEWHEEIDVSMPDGEYMITSAKIKKGQGSPYEAWLSMDMPQNISPMQEEMLRFKSMMEYDFEIARAENGLLKTSFQLEADEVVYLEIQKKDVKAFPRSRTKEFLEEWNRSVEQSKKRCL